MATKKVYTSKAKTTSITAGLKMTLNIGNNYFSVQVNEERALPEDDNTVDTGKEWEFLWEDVQKQCEDKVRELKEQFKPKRRK